MNKAIKKTIRKQNDFKKSPYKIKVLNKMNFPQMNQIQNQIKMNFNRIIKIY